MTEAALRGHAELRIPSRPGVMFAAPTLVAHYVDVHSYGPPADFIEAVRGYDPGWMVEPSPWVPDHVDRLAFS